MQILRPSPGASVCDSRAALSRREGKSSAISIHSHLVKPALHVSRFCDSCQLSFGTFAHYDEESVHDLLVHIGIGPARLPETDSMELLDCFVIMRMYRK